MMRSWVADVALSRNGVPSGWSRSSAQPVRILHDLLPEGAFPKQGGVSCGMRQNESDSVYTLSSSRPRATIPDPRPRPYIKPQTGHVARATWKESW
jgi:hypothetical protein